MRSHAFLLVLVLMLMLTPALGQPPQNDNRAIQAINLVAQNGWLRPGRPQNPHPMAAAAAEVGRNRHDHYGQGIRSAAREQAQARQPPPRLVWRVTAAGMRARQRARQQAQPYARRRRLRLIK
ncbi:hypothetical protein HDU96_004790 [Phlyctochytrium bullatum]|nr:hypothetical protein HDU96_004790 [Phlyctochytrium bullatum]